MIRIGDLLTSGMFDHPIDSPAYVDCPNEDCPVGRTSLDRNLEDDGTITCECGTQFRLRYEVIEDD